ncbi:MAG: alpha-mannosidase [Clostridia bacterium]|nr:alpha-mannosidase [Clostridia bacterium]
MDFIKEKIEVSLENFKKLMETKLKDIEFEYVKCGYKDSNEFPEDTAGWLPFREGERLSGIDEHFWLRFTVDPVKKQDGKELVFSLKTRREGQWDASNPQGLIFLNGKTVQALDINHTWVGLEFDTAYNVYIYFYTGMEGGYFDVLPQLLIRDLPVYKLYYDIKVPYEAMLVQSSSSYEYIQIKDTLDKALMRVDFRDAYSDNFYKGISSASEYLENELYGKLSGGNGALVSCIGHTHIDVAWLWTVAQTREKAERSFATVLNLMKRYPEYKFMSSQPQLYSFVKESNPELFNEIKEMVKEGRWEVEGAMWLEADCNLISGESMVRQILHGKRFMKEEFGVDSKILWLPDVFGYSGALPQILRKSGVDRFFTAKISWNESNQLPHDTFIWQGIDGTEIFASLIETYVKMLDAKEIHRTWDIYKDKSMTNETLVTFGYGDGGGGPTPEMLENYRRLEKGLPGMPKAVIKKAGAYFDDIEKDFVKNTAELRRTPKWIGELYLEMHRGTYTSIAKNKRNNRKSELLYQEAETLSVMDMLLCGGKYDSETFERNQINILLNQFHDIIPGSSIKEVYDVTDTEYERILREGREIADNKLDSIKSRVTTDGGIFVYNPTPFEISDFVEADGSLYYAENIPAHGFKVISGTPVPWGVETEDKAIENDLIRVEFDDSYQIISIFDKELGREIVSEGCCANRLEIYEDYPRCYDAWEITDYYKQKMWICDDVTSSEKTPRGVKVVRRYGNSVIEQEIALRKGSKRIDFITRVDWHEDHVLLKAAFPVDIHASNAVYDIQFGNIERTTCRNNSWDAAKFEVCGHKWADISESGYGVSLLNDCKYGYSAEENVITISLLKSATYPNPEADRGINIFTYSLYPHEGDFRQGKTVREGYLLNMPLEAGVIPESHGSLPPEFSLVSCDCENVCVETIKKAEDDNSVIVRLFECYNKKVNASLNFGFDFKRVYLCSLMEENENEVDFDGRTVTIPVRNYEIVTLKLEI